MPILQFEPFSSQIDGTFWEKLGKLKIDLYKLDDSEKEIYGYYRGGERANDSVTALPARLFLSSGSFDKEHVSFAVNSPGTLKNTNTLNEFKDLDKNAFLKESASKIWDAIKTGAVIENPQLLVQFGLITFADLKKYRFYYWFNFPCLLPKTPYNCTKSQYISEIYSESQLEQVKQAFHDFYDSSPNCNFFLYKITVGFIDPSASEQPGWPLRNFLLAIQQNWDLSQVKVLCYRESLKSQSINSSLLIHVEIAGGKIDTLPEYIGWEKGPKGQPTPRLANLAPLMDPKQLADTAVDLNLKLMRWRILPLLNLESISSKKCLLLGAGTLGCYVARLLMAWGVRHITFVDNGKVSFSNPVRQPLFTFEDCLDGGAPKAKAAAKGLTQVFPGVEAKGIDLSIPMPGHLIDTENVTKARIIELEKLIADHDVMFLLTDSRESRWLPTVLGAKLQKIVINTALGFDSFLVMRHGMRDIGQNVEQRLGCYFCNDVVAPVDSLTDRTLDQQCTVTRPGLSALAGGLAVELLASICNHNEGPWAPADQSVSISDSANSTPLGIIPHQIRGFLAHFQNLILVGSGYNKCSACSDPVLKQYEQDGIEFLMKAMADSKYLEQVAGLDQMKMESEDIDVDWDEDM
ncbi:Autophagy protein 7 [Boothiomyces sp. JEL0866]|nr:Autophagy protein 7 [Boothiomyces sp. JEL0866]